MTRHSDLVCSLCGCLCDDLIVDLDGIRITGVDNACPSAQSVFQRLNSVSTEIAFHRETVCALDEGIAQAAEIFRNSRAPLIFGMAGASTETHRAAILLAERLGAVMDTAGAALTRACTLAMQHSGISTCTLGEIKQRADLIIFWGADPARTHPRLLERDVNPKSEFLPNGRADRKVITIQAEETLTGQTAEEVFRIRPGSDFEIITALRMLIRDGNASIESAGGLSAESLRHLVELMITCRYGVVFPGAEILSGDAPHLTVEMLFRLVAELNAHTRFVARPLSHSGAENVLAWQTGFPLAVDFQQGYPRYQPGEFSANELLEQGLVDAFLLIGSDAVENLSPAALKTLQQCPGIVLDSPHLECPFAPTVRIRTAFPGVHAAGSMYRFDDVALPLRQLYESPFPRAEEVLDKIRTQGETP